MSLAMADGYEPLKSDEDVEEILRLAVRGSNLEGASLRDRLTNSARELGISDDELARAEATWARQMADKHSVESEWNDRKLYRKLRFGDFLTHFGTYAVINAFLFWIDFRDGSVGWSYWAIFGWGIAVAIHFVSLFAHGQSSEQEFQRWRKKRYPKKKSKE
ncbi:MAG: 2TM domain-containing protein [Chthonomonadaceae bacterium]|nr:2TM domain-containing protein [Chthonomonadaceae bacterium]